MDGATDHACGPQRTHNHDLTSATITSATTHRNAPRRILSGVFGVTEKIWINVTRASRIRVSPMRRARRTAHPNSRRA